MSGTNEKTLIDLYMEELDYDLQEYNKKKFKEFLERERAEEIHDKI